ncbi:MAG TPA: hypothetical protein DEF51_50415, partial [Myxococcales bacterium]|nr:hypothetical protein [Myxococcales bacterium]
MCGERLPLRVVRFTEDDERREERRVEPAVVTPGRGAPQLAEDLGLGRVVLQQRPQRLLEAMARRGALRAVEQRGERLACLEIGWGRRERPLVRRDGRVPVQALLGVNGARATLEPGHGLGGAGVLDRVGQRLDRVVVPLDLHRHVGHALVDLAVREADLVQGAELGERPRGVVELLLQEVRGPEARDPSLAPRHVGRGGQGLERVPRPAEVLLLHLELDEQREAADVRAVEHQQVVEGGQRLFAQADRAQQTSLLVEELHELARIVDQLDAVADQLEQAGVVVALGEQVVEAPVGDGAPR